MPVRGFVNEASAYGYYYAHKTKCQRPVEFAPGEWEVPNGSKDITFANPIKGRQTYVVPYTAETRNTHLDVIRGGKEDSDVRPAGKA